MRIGKNPFSDTEGGCLLSLLIVLFVALVVTPGCASKPKVVSAEEYVLDLQKGLERYCDNHGGVENSGVIPMQTENMVALVISINCVDDGYGIMLSVSAGYEE